MNLRDERRAIPTYLENPAVVRFRTSKNVKKTAIETSTAAATARDEVAIPFPPNAKVAGSKHKLYPYHEETVL